MVGRAGAEFADFFRKFLPVTFWGQLRCPKRENRNQIKTLVKV
jgi:hypothetical protein